MAAGAPKLEETDVFMLPTYARTCLCDAGRILLVPALEQGDVQLAGVLLQLLHSPCSKGVARGDGDLWARKHRRRTWPR